MFACKGAIGGHLFQESLRLKFHGGQDLEHYQTSGELEMFAEIQHKCCACTWCA